METWRQWRGCAVTLTGQTASGLAGRQTLISSVVAHSNSDQNDAGRRDRVGLARDGARAYVCVHGGLDVPVVLGDQRICVQKWGHQRAGAQAGDILKSHSWKPARSSLSQRHSEHSCFSLQKMLRIIRRGGCAFTWPRRSQQDEDHANFPLEALVGQRHTFDAPEI